MVFLTLHLWAEMFFSLHFQLLQKELPFDISSEPSWKVSCKWLKKKALTVGSELERQKQDVKADKLLAPSSLLSRFYCSGSRFGLGCHLMVCGIFTTKGCGCTVNAHTNTGAHKYTFSFLKAARRHKYMWFKVLSFYRIWLTMSTFVIRIDKTDLL